MRLALPVSGNYAYSKTLYNVLKGYLTPNSRLNILAGVSVFLGNNFEVINVLKKFDVTGFPQGDYVYISFPFGVNGSSYVVMKINSIYLVGENGAYLVPIEDKVIDEVSGGQIPFFKFIQDHGPIRQYLELVKNEEAFIMPANQQVNVPQDVVARSLLGRVIGMYRLADYLGQGGVAYVFKAESRGKEYVVKIPKSDYENLEAYLMSLLSEASAIISMSADQRIVKVYAVHVDTNILEYINDQQAYYLYPPYIVMEYLRGGDLKKYMENPAFTSSKYWKYIAYYILYYVSDALRVIHSKGYAHLDVKPANILIVKPYSTPEELYADLTQYLVVKLGDLGASTRIREQITLLSPEYSPPDEVEYMVKGKGARPLMDIFSLGMTFLKILDPKIQRPDLQYIVSAISDVRGDKDRVMQLLSYSSSVLSNWNPPVLDTLEPEIKELVLKMITPSLYSRPTAKEVRDTIAKYIRLPYQ
ncbi:protein kinase domain-containing protein [Stygiolobus caldivivus]|uniref:Protein kinase domain-containing protein n=1 Tax=Stygiolobus caldivivus TaxID=2824673 RepID=A0A8D5U6P7_9CREN|nr:protein kinase [Stygiolobus caldivivus]BCU69997.1 hypothetical protein KN1_12940 [Stygiolobus caldivivus]